MAFFFPRKTFPTLWPWPIMPVNGQTVELFLVGNFKSKSRQNLFNSQTDGNNQTSLRKWLS
jgi:hypothetical protein